jgi:hypothetical protein
MNRKYVLVFAIVVMLFSGCASVPTKDIQVDAGYFNPRPITVSRAFASVETGRLNLFIKLQGKGYPGSTYTLIYNEKNDTLVGIYYQAALRQSFDVAFVRKKQPGSQ